MQPDTVANKNKDIALMYIHGLGCSPDDFKGAADEPSLKGTRILSLTHPGCDSTTYPDASLDLDSLVEMAHSLASGVGRLALVGHSIGGAVAVRYAERYPKNVVGIVGVEGNLTSNDCFLTRRISLQEETRESLIQRFEESENPGFRRFASRLLNVDSRALRDYALSAVEHSDRGDLFGAFSNLPTPRLFIYGDQNANSIDYLDDLRAKGVQVAEITNSNHFPGADNPTQYYRAIGEFVAAL